MNRYTEVLLKKVDFKCKACGADLTKVPWHVDHIHPKSRGGQDVIENFQILCATCNISKHAKTMDEWRPWLLRLDGSPIDLWEELRTERERSASALSERALTSQYEVFLGPKRSPRGKRGKRLHRQEVESNA